MKIRMGRYCFLLVYFNNRNDKKDKRHWSVKMELCPIILEKYPKIHPKNCFFESFLKCFGKRLCRQRIGTEKQYCYKLNPKKKLNPRKSNPVALHLNLRSTKSQICKAGKAKRFKRSLVFIYFIWFLLYLFFCFIFFHVCCSEKLSYVFLLLSE